MIETAANAVEPIARRPCRPSLTRSRVTGVRFTLPDVIGALFGVPGARRAIVWVDQEVRLPDKVEVFDEAGTVLERHRFRNLR